METLTWKVRSRGRSPRLIVEEATGTSCSCFTTPERSDQQSGLLFPSKNQWESVSDGLSRKANNLRRTGHPILKVIVFPPTQALKLLQTDVEMDTGCARLRSHRGTLIARAQPCTVGLSSPMFPWFPWCPSVQLSPVSASVVLQLSHFSPVWNHSDCRGTAEGRILYKL